MHPYLRLLAMTALSFIAMYVLMYAMVDKLDDIYPNINQFYMAALMAAPMVLIEVALMRHMYEKRTANVAIVLAALVVMGGSWTLIRQQTAVADVQFLKSMIPHHSGAILMCQDATITDPEIKELCGTIVAGQQSEIDRMKLMLGRLDRG
jgi:uncharacterized protein (DUF305 family)